MQTSQINASTGLYTFLKSLIDYAGLFPPASLDLPEAFANFVAYVDSSDEWMLGRFIIPAKRLGELADIGNTHLAQDKHLYRFSVLGRGGASAGEFLDNLDRDQADIETFTSPYPNTISVDIYEVRIPSSVLAERDHSALLQVFNAVQVRLKPTRPFFEVPLTAEWEEQVQWVLENLHQVNADKDHPVGYKLRCGGVTPDLFPTPQQVAFALHQAHIMDVPMKGTAGLHHPVRHYNEEVGTKMHGFLNVFGAGLFARIHDWDAEKLIPIIEEENPSHFRFDDTGFHWKEYHITPDQINQVRQTGMISYGSCSFDEPREDLQALGLL